MLEIAAYKKWTGTVCCINLFKSRFDQENLPGHDLLQAWSRSWISSNSRSLSNSLLALPSLQIKDLWEPFLQLRFNTGLCCLPHLLRWRYSVYASSFESWVLTSLKDCNWSQFAASKLGNRDIRLPERNTLLIEGSSASCDELCQPPLNQRSWRHPSF